MISEDKKTTENVFTEYNELEQRIKEQENIIRHLSDYADKLVDNRDRIRGLLRDFDTGKKSAAMLISYLRMYV